MVPEVVGSKPIIHPLLYISLSDVVPGKMAELVDALDLESSGLGRGGSSPPSRIV